jgi:transcriptional regulator with XRE-family HTH domain
VGTVSRDDIKEFLASRRARITPQQAGLTAYGRNRRVPGLRREEVAMLAGVSIDYYTRLERGNLSGVSDTVLEALAGALQLDEAERGHLFDLARASASPCRPRRRAAGRVRPGLLHLLEAMTDAPAFVCNGRLDVLAANRLGRALYSLALEGSALAGSAPGGSGPTGSGPAGSGSGGSGPGGSGPAGPAHAGSAAPSSARPANLARFAFLDPRAADFYANWDEVANTTVALLRTEAGRDPCDRGLSDLVGELATRSEPFRVRWAAHDVRLHQTGVKHFHHPVVGDLALGFEAVPLPADPGLTLTAYSAEPGSAAQDALQLLASWSATPDDRHPQPGLTPPRPRT